MTQSLGEDELYRASSQYRLWSFAPEHLANLRQQTHDLGVDLARRNHAANGTAQHDAIQYVSEADELRLVQRYCEQLRATSDRLKFAPSVKATAVQYLKRFYVSNSVITYPPKEIYKTALFLACKTEGTHMTLSEYSHRIKTEKDVILAPEFKIMQALRFTLDVRQPFRGLKGVLMEALNFVSGIGAPDGIQEQMMRLANPQKTARTPWKSRPEHDTSSPLSTHDLNDRIQAAYAAARSVCDAPALLTDVYFLYTPSQIVIAALHLADAPFADLYLSTKLPLSLPSRPKILATIQSCAEMLAAFSEADVMSKDERSLIEERLELCRDPATCDLVKNHMQAKRGDSDEEEEKNKRRQLEREKHSKEGDDLFGPALGNG